MKNETIIKIMEKLVDSGWCLEPDGINRMPEKPEETEFYHILSSFLEPRRHLRDDADLADIGRPLKYQYKENK